MKHDYKVTYWKGNEEKQVVYKFYDSRELNYYIQAMIGVKLSFEIEAL